MLTKKLLLIGAGGHCESILDSALSAGVYTEIGIIDNDTNASVSGIPVIGCDRDLPALFQAGWTDAFIAVGSVGYVANRRRLYNAVVEIGYHVPAVIDPTAVVARDISIADGAFIGKCTVVNTGSRIGKCAIINTGSIIEHGCTIGDFAHVSPGATLCGQVCVGENTHVGAGSTVRQGIRIGSGVMIGAGSVIVSNIEDGVKAFGVPCKVVSAWACI